MKTVFKTTTDRQRMALLEGGEDPEGCRYLSDN